MIGTKPFYELMLDIRKKQEEQQKINNKILSNQDDADRVKADILLNQMDIMAKQEEQDAVLAEILLSGLGV